MTIIVIAVAIALGVGAWFVWGRKKEGAASPIPITPNNPWTIGPIVNGANYSQGMPPQPTVEGAGWFFDFPLGPPGVHGMTRPWGSVGGGTLTMSYQVDGAATFIEVDAPDPSAPGPGKVRLFLQRSGDDWSGAGERASYRWYSQPLNLAPGPATLSVPLTPENWTNVYGQPDPAGFAACLANLATVGMGFGGSFAMHGAYATSPASFHLREFNLG